MRRLSVIAGVLTTGITATTVLATAPGAGAATGSTEAAAAPGSARTLVTAALAYAATHDVHYTSVATQGGATLRVAGDTARTSGTETLTVRRGSMSSALNISVIGTTGFVKGNRSGLGGILGLTPQQAATEAGRWLSFPTGRSQAVDQLLVGLINQDVARELTLGGPLNFGATTTVDGQRARAIDGFTDSSSGKAVATVLYVESGPVPRPLREVSDPGAGTSGVNGSVTFSRWGEPTRVPRPTHAIPLLPLLPVG